MGKKHKKKKQEADNLLLIVGILHDISESLQVIAYALNQEQKRKERIIQKGSNAWQKTV